jgi:uronate dehydrogenase/NAD+ dependent glucose-6-phosphate dehydrogenase
MLAPGSLPRLFAWVATRYTFAVQGVHVATYPFVHVRQLVWAKLAYEALGFLYATGSQGRKLENVQVRIGAPRPIRAAHFFPNGPTGQGANPVGYRRDLGAYISPRDLTQLFVKSIEAPSIEDEHGIPFQAVYGISNNARAFWSLVNARRVLGYAPEDDAEIEYAEEILAYLVKPARAG